MKRPAGRQSRPPGNLLHCDKDGPSVELETFMKAYLSHGGADELDAFLSRKGQGERKTSIGTVLQIKLREKHVAQLPLLDSPA